MKTCLLVSLFALCASQPEAWGEAESARYREVKAFLDSVPAIDTHDHIWRFDELPGLRETAEGKVMNLASIWQNSYLSWHNVAPGWRPDDTPLEWWRRAKPGFANVRAMSVYRYTLPALRDLYGVDFETMTDEQAVEVSGRITANYRDQRWLYEVITEKANIEVVLNDPYWEPYDFACHYGFVANVLRLNPLFKGFHPSEFAVIKGNRRENPYEFAQAQKIEIKSFDDYLGFIDRLFVLAKEAGLVGLKHTLAYQRTLSFDKVPKERAAEAFGRPRSELKPEQVKAFEDFLMWHLCELSAKHALPFQIHTGHARIQGSNPMLLVDVIEANPRTQFALFHGGFPWIGESAAIAARHRNVHLDTVWLPTLSQTMARRALHEWLDVLPADRILWGADCNHAEGIYGATEITRRVLAEVLAERVDRGELRMEDAQHIGRLILRENALKLFPGIKAKLWRHKQERMEPK
jgi:uncharacterized protein